MFGINLQKSFDLYTGLVMIRQNGFKAFFFFFFLAFDVAQCWIQRWFGSIFTIYEITIKIITEFCNQQ